jgi:hypothetical protein
MRRSWSAAKFSSYFGQVARRRAQGEDFNDIHRPRAKRKERNREQKKVVPEEAPRPRSYGLLGLTWAWIRNLFTRTGA